MFASRNNGSLKQGEQFKTMQKMFNNAVKNIGKSSYVGLEGIEGSEKTKMETLIESFRRTLENYKRAYARHLRATTSNSDIRKYYGNTIKANNSDEIFYITTRGVKRKIGTGQGSEPPGWGESGKTGWDAKTNAHGCPQITDANTVEPEIIDNWELEGEDIKYKKLQNPEGDRTHYFQRCDSAWSNGGVFIQKDGTEGSGLSWYDHKGKRHDFKDNVTRDIAHNSCPKRSGATESIPQIEYDSLMQTSGTKLDENTPCPNIIYGDKGSDVTSLNNRLIDIAIEMKTEINSIIQRSNDTDESSREAKRNLDTLINEVKDQRKKIKNLEKEIFSLDTTITDNTYLVKSINLHYIAWGLSLVTIGLIGIHQLKKM